MPLTHPEMVRRLVKNADEILKVLTPQKADYLHATLGIVSEAGEIADACKKVFAYGQTPNLDNIIEELGDLEFYMEHLRQCFGITREETLDANMKKLAKRYPGFDYSDGKAKERLDKVGVAS